MPDWSNGRGLTWNSPLFSRLGIGQWVVTFVKREQLLQKPKLVFLLRLTVGTQEYRIYAACEAKNDA